MKVKTEKRGLASFVGIVVALVLAVSLIAVPAYTSSANIASTLDKTKVYESQYDSLEDTIQAGKDLNLEIAAEGFILLKNKDGALPLAKEERKVTVLGAQADSLAYGGGGSGGQGTPGKNSVVAGKKTDIFDGLEAAGITANPRIRDRYLSVNPVAMTREPSSFSTNYRESGHYMEKVTEGGEVEFAGNSYKSIANGSLAGADGNLEMYDDAAIVVISRSGAEGADNPSHNVDGHSDVNEHYLELDDAEKELMAYAKKHFEKIIVIINSPSVMELGCLEYDDSVGAILWIGQPGWNGTMVIGDILTGKINPSGRTVDFYMTDFTSDPVWYNSTDYTPALYALTGEYRNDDLGVTVAPHTIPMGKEDGSEATNNQEAIDYAEGIYVGYRYYETVATDLGDKGEEWYRSNVLYPYGHGLSYTTFSQKIAKVEGDLKSANGKVTVSVEVKNTGAVAGKEVVQLYSTPPYTKGGIEKAAVNLVGFAKTGKLAPGASETVEIEIAVKDLASFDYNDKNKNDFCGYELETGEYVLSIRENSHVALDSETLTCETALTWDEDGNPATPNNIYSQPTDSKWGQYNTLSHAWTTSGTDHYLTRDKLVVDGKVGDLKQLSWMIANDGADNEFKDGAFAVLNRRYDNDVTRDFDDAKTFDKETDYENLWTVKEVPANWTQGSGSYDIKYRDMLGVALDDAKWDTFLNQLTWKELVDSISAGSFSNPAVPNVEKDSITDNDGPGQLKGRNNAGNGWAWACAVVVASTWNTELCYEQGRIIGNESMWIGTSGWYGPGLDTHRSPLAGRNFEYYSQDGVQGGLIASSIIKGATDMGCHVYMKHAFLNDQETNRLDMATFVTEQAIREIYAKPFELSVKKGNANGMMASFNLIGIESSLGYATVVQMYKNEWGFDGFSVTDMWGGSTSYARASGWTGYAMARSFTQPLGNNKTGAYVIQGDWDATARGGKGTVTVSGAESLTQWYWVRETAKHMFYTTVNSNGAKNGFSSSKFANATIDLTLGKAADADILTASAKAAFGASGFEVTTTSTLPAGLKIENGKLKGTPTALAGGAKIAISVVGKYGLGWIKGTTNVTVNVTAPTGAEEKVTLDNKTMTLGTAYTGQAAQTAVTLTADNYVAGGQANAANNGKYVSLAFTATGLPAGLTMANDGAITGTPTETGTFYVAIRARLGKVYYDQSGWRPSYKIANEDYYGGAVITIDGYNVTFAANDGSGNTQVIGVAAGSNVTGDTLAGDITNPTRAGGYKFLGWATKANATSPDVTLDNNLTVNKATTYYAVWQMPSLAIVNGVWYIDGVSTGIKAEGQNGSDGVDGKPGENGEDGANGVGILSIEKTTSEGLVDKYVITLTNGQTFEFEITNGEKGEAGEKGEKGETGAAGKDAEVKEGGCGSTVETTGAAVVVAIVLAGAAVVLLMKRRRAAN